MINDFIAQLQTRPDWIGYGLAVFAVMVVVLVALLAWRRSDQVKEAQRDAASLRDQLTRLEDELTLAKQDLSAFREETVALRTNEARLQEALAQQRQANEEKLAMLRDTGDKLKGEFKLLAADVIRAQGDEFEKTHQQRMRRDLEPLRLNIEAFKAEMQNIQKETIAERATLKNEIKILTERSLQVSQEAENLTRALKADTQKQGAWGEMVLASILDRTGLREGEEYTTQTSFRDENGSLLRPDVVVNLPGGRKIVIDSKVSLVAYERAMTADNPGERETAMKAHVASVKSHIDGLAGKKYHEVDDNSVDYVIMFLPLESAFSEAVRVNADLALYAAERNVVIASPTNLMVALKTVENLWSVERRNANALEIAKRAGRLYDKFHGFVEDMEKIGVQLDTTRKTYDAALGKLSTGQGNLLSQADTLKKLGAKASKDIQLRHQDEDMLDAPDSDADDEES